jgi:MerR family redox-sensitive transcriptional activator SoxR
MRIGELAKRVGLRPSALRYYEQIGVLPAPARVSGRREYGDGAANALRMLLALQEAGFTLAEARPLLRGFGPGRHVARRWHAVATAKLAEIDARIARLRTARTTLAGAVDCACRGRAERCRLVR